MRRKIIPAAIVIAVIAAISIIGMILLSGSAEGDNIARAVAPRNAEDALRFKEEHEAFNDILDDEGNLRHVNMYIPEDNRVIYIEFDDLMDMIDSGTGMFFFSRPVCPWCRILLPTLLQVAEDMDIYIHYYDIDYDRSAHNERYVRILEALHDYLPVDDRNQTPGDPDFDENMKRVTVPHLFFMVEGRVVNEIMMNRHPLLTAEDVDYDELYDFLANMFSSVRQVIHSTRSACREC